MRWYVAVTTIDPEASFTRKEQTYDRCHASLERAGWNDGDNCERHDFEDGESNGLKRLGCWFNYKFALETAVDEGIAPDLIMVVQDDTVFAGKGLRRWCERFIPAYTEQVGCYSLLTRPRDAITLDRPIDETLAVGDGWHPVDLHSRLNSKSGYCGAHCIIWPLESAVEFLASDMVKNYGGSHPCLHPYEVRNVDTLIGNWCLSAQKQIMTISPSLADHIGETSTLAPDRRLISWRKGKDFVGEDYVMP